VISSARIALDVDGRFWHGDTHHKTRGSHDRDYRKTQALTDAGWTLVRIREAPLTPVSPNDLVVVDLRHLKDVVVAVTEHLVNRFGLAAPGLPAYRVHDRLAAEDQANGLILRYQKGTVAGHTLAELFPAVAAQWHPDLNGVLTPASVFAQSNRSAWWSCEQGHDWYAIIQSRSQGNGCPYCSGNKVGQGNSLADRHPELAAQWHPHLNATLTPQQVTAGTTRKAWWQCAKGHEWHASIASRTRGNSCPDCSGHRASGAHNLATINPELAAQWHPVRNGDLTADRVTPGSSRTVWWQCSRGHEWQAPISNRKAGRGCSYCSGHAVGQGNTLADQNPALAAEWHPTRNGKLTPPQVVPHAGRRVWWSCQAGHEWQAIINNRANGTACPYCTRQRMEPGRSLSDVLPALAAEWHPHRNGDLRPDEVTSRSTRTAWWRCGRGHDWQAPIRSRANGSTCPYCSRRRATPEHNLAVLHPQVATEWHPSKNASLTAQQVTPGSDRTVWWRCGAGHEWSAAVANRVRGTGCPYCSGHRVGQGNSLADRYPDLAADWHPNRNGDLRPQDVSPGSGQKPWWQCSAGHEWQATIGSRTAGTGCPHCSGRRATHTRNLASVYPDLAAQWHPARNGNLEPDEVPPRSSQHAWWCCPKGHEWSATVLNRSGGSGCPYCSGRRATPERTLAALRPDLAEQWHPKRNGDFRPQDVSPGSGKKAWWQCSAGHEWQATIGSRTAGAGCRRCSTATRFTQQQVERTA
jgi:DNA-directed RNA polymerase subunit RPC12/RpoP